MPQRIICHLVRTITGHAWLAWDTSGNDHNLCALEGSSQTGRAGLVANNLEPSAIVLPITVLIEMSSLCS